MSVQILQKMAQPSQSPGCAILTEIIPPPALRAYLSAVSSWIARRAQRAALRELADDPRLLNDLELTRDQALREARRPFWRQ
jgi:uncharacterized protein YjiS (DUF1127 family)